MAADEQNASIIERELELYDSDQVRGLALIGLDRLKGKHPNPTHRPISPEEIHRLKSRHA